jgi:hypothetical protein
MSFSDRDSENLERIANVLDPDTSSSSSGDDSLWGCVLGAVPAVALLAFLLSSDSLVLVRIFDWCLRALLGFLSLFSS